MRTRGGMAVVVVVVVLGIFSVGASSQRRVPDAALSLARTVASSTTLSIIGQDGDALGVCRAQSSASHLQWVQERVAAFREYASDRNLKVTFIRSEARDIQVLSVDPSGMDTLVRDYVEFRSRLGDAPEVTSEIVYEHHMRLRPAGDRWIVERDFVPDGPGGEMRASIPDGMMSSDVGVLTYQFPYSRSGAVSYADSYWSSYNVGPYKDISAADCTNFMSQCMHSGGGLPSHNFGLGKTDYNNWWYDNKGTTGISQTGDDTWSDSWSVSETLHTFILNFNGGNGYDVGSAYELSLGDIIFYDWDANGVQNHAALVTLIQNGTPYVSAHDSDRHNVLWDLSAYPHDPRTLYTFTHLNTYWYYN